MSLPEEHRSMLEKLVTKADELEEADEHVPFNADAFRGMLDRDRALTAKQEQWVVETYEKTFGESHTLNLFSRGLVPTSDYGKTEVPEVLRRPLPMKPPGRK